MIRYFLILIFCLLYPLAHYSCGNFVDHQNARIESLPTIQKLTFYSDVLKENRVLLVRLPKGYQQTKRKYQVLYVLDAEFHFQHTASAIEFLSECGYQLLNPMMPQVIVVGIVNVDRNRDYTPTACTEQGTLRFPTSGKGERFLKFFEIEVIPLIDSKYRTHPCRVITGWSFGGLFTVFAFLERPHLFNAYVAMSPSLWWDKKFLVKRAETLLRSGGMSKKTLVVTLGSAEQGGGDISIGDSVYRSFLPLMREEPAKDLDFRLIKIPEEGHYYVPYKAIYEGLKALYVDWILPEDDLNKGTVTVKRFYESLSLKYGYKVELPESSYYRLTWRLFQQGKVGEAIKTALECLKRYPALSYSHYLAGRLYHLQNNTELAIKYYTKACEIEKTNPIPDSEWLGTYEYHLKSLVIDKKQDQSII